MPNYTCAHCGKPFKAERKKNVKENRRCCSKSCASRNRITFLRKYTTEFLIEALQRVAQELGRTPYASDMKGPTQNTYVNRFGSWRKAILAAGLTPSGRCPAVIFYGERRLVSLRQRFVILRRDKFTCQYCGGTPQNGFELHVDHVVPYASGGKTIKENLITSCFACNVGKSSS